MSKLMETKVRGIERVLARDRDSDALRRLHEALAPCRDEIAEQYAACRNRVIELALLTTDELADVEYTLRHWDIEGYARRRAVKMIVGRLPSMTKRQSERMHLVAEHTFDDPYRT